MQRCPPARSATKGTADIVERGRRGTQVEKAFEAKPVVDRADAVLLFVSQAAGKAVGEHADDSGSQRPSTNPVQVARRLHLPALQALFPDIVAARSRRQSHRQLGEVGPMSSLRLARCGVLPLRDE